MLTTIYHIPYTILLPAINTSFKPNNDVLPLPYWSTRALANSVATAARPARIPVATDTDTMRFYLPGPPIAK